MDVIFDARNPDEFFAFLALALVRNGWRRKTACVGATLILALHNNPTLATVPHLLESRTKAFEREVKRIFVECYAAFIENIHADAPTIDCIYVDGAFECRWRPK